MTQSEYPSVLLIYTGGTIGMIENPETGASLPTNLIPLSTLRIWNLPCGPS